MTAIRARAPSRIKFVCSFGASQGISLSTLCPCWLNKALARGRHQHKCDVFILPLDNGWKWDDTCLRRFLPPADPEDPEGYLRQPMCILQPRIMLDNSGDTSDDAKDQLPMQQEISWGLSSLLAALVVARGLMLK
ncbi:uncharacterized protein ARMOST_06891 [Armillaria ostoyae]|uniref:Uncharacterized protein n=1 Tax=Armillaria ostoyae TaxID=47428 RepID=A0A284R4C3_ARMOS|nr:uncharacterized protein ARMOST_06891 [Armillaria ostoyae]